MTKVNAYANALNNVVNDRSISATNKKKMQALVLLASRDNVNAMLTECAVDASLFDKRAMYMSEKSIKFVAAINQNTCSASDFNDNAFATFKTALLCEDASVHITKDMICAALTKDYKLNADAEKTTYRRNNLFSAQTLAAQSQQCVDMLKTLKIVREVAKQTFEINKESAILQRARAMITDLAL